MTPRTKPMSLSEAMHRAMYLVDVADNEDACSKDEGVAILQDLVLAAKLEVLEEARALAQKIADEVRAEGGYGSTLTMDVVAGFMIDMKKRVAP